MLGSVEVYRLDHLPSPSILLFRCITLRPGREVFAGKPVKQYTSITGKQWSQLDAIVDPLHSVPCCVYYPAAVSVVGNLNTTEIEPDRQKMKLMFSLQGSQGGTNISNKQKRSNFITRLHAQSF